MTLIRFGSLSKTKENDMTLASNVRQAIANLEEAEERIEQARLLLLPVAAQSDGPDAGARVLAEVLRRGGSVTREELYQIAADNGMDRRGLGGFFRQSGKSSLYVLPGDRVILTPYGVEQARRYAEPSRGIEYEPGTEAFTKIAEPSFAEDWDSPEDSIYDES
jgi:hypothetical protein